MLVSVSNPQISGVPETTIELSSDNSYWQIDNVMNVYYACYDQFGRLEMTATDDITSLKDRGRFSVLKSIVFNVV